jgi:hypothetical protein
MLSVFDLRTGIHINADAIVKGVGSYLLYGCSVGSWA